MICIASGSLSHVAEQAMFQWINLTVLILLRRLQIVESRLLTATAPLLLPSAFYYIGKNRSLLCLSCNFLQGFRKIDPDRWEFANEGFLKGQKHLLKSIKRRKAQQLPAHQQQTLDVCVEVGRLGVEGEVDWLMGDKKSLMVELVKLRQQQQNTRAHVQAMEERIQGAELKQQHMMQFLARAMQNPVFVQQLLRHKERRKELEEAMSKKRRRPIDQVANSGRGDEGKSSGSWAGVRSVKPEPLELGEYGVSELEALALEMQGYGRGRRDADDVHDELEQVESGSDRELDEGFWEDLLSENTGVGEDEDVNALVERLGYLGSSPK